MAAPSFSIDFEPDTRFFVQDFLSLGANIRSLKPALEGVVRNIMVPAIRHNFNTQSSAGVPWRSLSDTTHQRKAAEGYGNKPALVRTGKLKRAATSRSAWDLDGDSATLNMNRLPKRGSFPYGIAHQFGAVAGRAPSVNIPARPWVVMDQATQDQVYDYFVYWVQLRVNQAMRRRGQSFTPAGGAPVFTPGGAVPVGA